MTPSMNMGMKGPQQAGLASIGQPATQPRGKSPESIGEIMALAKKLSDGELSDILAGKSMAVPQYVAMTEAMGRRSLRNAVKGAQAMAQAKQPSIKDKLMMAEAAEQMPEMMQMAQPQMMAEGGLASLPAYNMDTVDMAGGGIIAFEGGGEVPRFNPGGPIVVDPRGVARMPQYPLALYEDPTKKIPKTGILKALGRRLPYIGAALTGADLIQGLVDSDTGTASEFLDPIAAMQGTQGGYDRGENANKPLGFYEQMQKEENERNAPPVAAPAAVDPDTPKPDNKGDGKGAGKGDGKGAGTTPSGGGGLSDLASFDDLLKRRTTDYLSKYEGLEDKKRARAAGVKKDLQSQVLLDASSALLGSRNLAEAGGKFGSKTASTLAAARAEQNQLEDAADQYGFNIAKAREAAEKGDMQLALQYTQLANQNKYQMGALEVSRERNAIMADAGNLGKVQLGLKNADAQALAEAKVRFANVPMNKKNQAEYEKFFRNRARELKLQNPLTKQYADLDGSALGSSNFSVVQSPRKGASVIDPTQE